ncbi:hypothetical protein PYW07_012845 [Mythimna separata]|uniref:Uncharacterized protein n=1 Tax=Mythimna separata TaxID=271217 RepID=A0AAD7Y8Z4_MYTSE|nr:hypothetical protein PYW07_012845 [Mythimna separata]
METVERPEHFPLLNDFFKIMAKGIVKNYCAICLRTEKERRLINNKALATYTTSFLLKKQWKNKYICFICHRQAEKALTFLRAVSFAGNMDTLYEDLLYQKRLNRDVIQTAVFQALIIKQGMVGLNSSPEYWEKELRIIRKATSLKLRRTRVTGVGTGRPEHERPSARNRYIVYEDPDEVSNPETDLASEPTTSNHTSSATTETVDLTASNHDNIDPTSSVNSEPVFATPEPLDLRTSIDLELAANINLGWKGAGWIRRRQLLTTPELERATRKDRLDLCIKRKRTHQKFRRNTNRLLVAEHNKSLRAERRKSIGDVEPGGSKSTGRNVRFDVADEDETVLVGEAGASEADSSRLPNPAVARPKKAKARSRSLSVAGPSRAPVAGPSSVKNRRSRTPVADLSYLEDIPSPPPLAEPSHSPVPGPSFAKDRPSRSPVDDLSWLEDIPIPLPLAGRKRSPVPGPSSAKDRHSWSPVAGPSRAPDIRSRSPVAGPSWAPVEPFYAHLADFNPAPVTGRSWSLVPGPSLAEPGASTSTAEADPYWSTAGSPNRTYEGLHTGTDDDEHRRRARKGKSLVSGGSGPKRSKNRQNNAVKDQRSEIKLNIARPTVKENSIVIPPQPPNETLVILEEGDEDEDTEMKIERTIPADMTMDPLLMGIGSAPAPVTRTQKHDNTTTTSKKQTPKNIPGQNTATKKIEDKKHIQKSTNSRRLSISGTSQSSSGQSVISRKRSLESASTMVLPIKVSVLPNTSISAGLSSYKIPKKNQNPSTMSPAMSPQYSRSPPWTPQTSKSPPWTPQTSQVPSLPPLVRQLSSSNAGLTIKLLNTQTSEPSFNPLMPPPPPGSHERWTPTNVRGSSESPTHPGAGELHAYSPSTSGPGSSPQMSPRSYVRTSPASIPILELDTGRSTQHSPSRPRMRPQTARRGYGRATLPNVRVPGAPRTPTDGGQVIIRAQASVGISPDPLGPRMGRPAHGPPHGPPHRPRHVGRNEGQPPVQDAIRRYTMTSEE